MASTYSDRLRLELMGSGDQSGTWGTTTNVNIGTLIEEAIAGHATVSMSDANYTLTPNSGVSDEARQMIIKLTGTLSASRNVICPTKEKLYVVDNATSGSQSIVFKTSSGSGITIGNGSKTIVYCDGTNVVDGVNYISSLTLGAALPVASGGTGLTSAGSSGNVLTSNGSAFTSSAPTVSVPSGAVMVFFQSGAPTGWTKLTSQDNKALRVVSGTGGGTGGSNAFTTALNSSVTATGATATHALVIGEIPEHAHSFVQKVYNQPGIGNAGGGGARVDEADQTSTTGVAGNDPANGHSHNAGTLAVNVNVQYIDVILCSKDA